MYEVGPYEDTLRSDLRKLAAAFNAETGQSLPTIGKRALNDNTFFARFETAEGGFNVRTLDKVVRWLWDNWPASLEWPADVKQPLDTVRDAPLAEPRA